MFHGGRSGGSSVCSLRLGGNGGACYGGGGTRLVVDVEASDSFGKLLGLMPQALCGGGRLLDQGGILLRHLVELPD